MLYHALRHPEITWRTRSYKLAWGGVAYETPPAKGGGSSNDNGVSFVKSPQKSSASLTPVTDEVHLILEDDAASADITSRDHGDVTTYLNHHHHHHHQNMLRLQSFPQNHHYARTTAVTAAPAAATIATTELHGIGSKIMLNPFVSSNSSNMPKIKS